MAWNLAGTLYENCSCDAICPCTWSNLARRATNDDCRGVLLFEIDAGGIGEIDMSGTTCALVIQAPALMTDGNLKIGVIIGDDASDEQADGLSQVFSGSLGGPLGEMGPMIGEFLGVERLPVSVSHDGHRHHITIGDVIDYDLVEELSPEGKQVELTNIVIHAAGPTLGLAQANAVSNSPFGITWSGDGLAGFSNGFSWAA
ncbi:MAG: DUF1326 domain-containing protein [Acidimicrobiia bacterium]|nr:DUF1326 domain-containing protein [Acidimicrobiia bacterium]